MSHYRRLFSRVIGHWPALTAVVVLTALAPLVTALQPWPIKLLIDHALQQGGDRPTIPGALQAVLGWLGAANPSAPTAGTLVLLAAGASLAIFLLSSLLESARSGIWSWAGQRLVYDLAAQMFARLQRLSLLFHGRQSVGDSLSRITGDSWCIYTATESLLISPLYNVITLLTVGGVALALDPMLAAVSLVIAPALAAATFAFGTHLKKRAQAQRRIESRLTGLVHQTLASIPLAQLFDAEQRNTQMYHSVAGDAVAISQQGVLLRNAFALTGGLLMTIGMAIVLYVGSYRVVSGAMSAGTLLVFVAYLRTIHGASNGLLQTWGALKTASASIERVAEVLESTDAIRSPARPRPLPARRSEIRVTFDAVTFGYEPQRPVLHEICLDVEPGQTLAVLGPTGAGKSTLLSMVPRLFDPWSGAVRFNGVDVRELDLAGDVRGSVAIVLQEPLLLPLSIAENIAYGRPDAARQQVIAAAVAADADAFIRALPQGYDTIVGERGATLSGGQKQRISIARAFLKDAPILILDEPTSALDGESEAAVMAALDRLMRGRAVLLIAHRLSTALHADRIVVIEQGRITQEGTPARLARQPGFYQNLCATSAAAQQQQQQTAAPHAAMQEQAS